ncbi:hypothetical protein ABPG74_000549 [Tetrahymena malaccensis]
MEGRKNIFQSNSSNFLMQESYNDGSQEQQKKYYKQAGNDSGLQIEDILRNINYGLQQINYFEDDIILVIGNSGSGKTSLSADLSGLQLIVKQTELKEKYLQYKDEELQQFGQIGTDQIQSETFIPNKFFNQSMNIAIWDTPGFDDSRGEEFQIPISFFINKIVNQAKRIKFILLIDGNQLNNGYGSEKGRDLKDMLFSFFSMIKDFRLDISNCSVIVISKANLKKKCGYYSFKIAKFVEDFLNENLEKLAKDNHTQFKDFLQQIAKTLVLLFPSIPDDEKVGSFYNKKPGIDILNAVKNELSYCRSEQIQIPMRVKNIEKINQLWKMSQRKMEEIFTNICDKISEGLKEFNEYQIKKAAQIIQYLQDLQASNEEQYFQQIQDQFQAPFLNLFLENKSQNQLEQLKTHFRELSFYFIDIYCDLIRKVQSFQTYRKCFFSKIQTQNGIKNLQRNLESAQKYLNLMQSQRQSKEMQQKNQNNIQNLMRVSDDFSQQQQELDQDNKRAALVKQEIIQQLSQQEIQQQRAQQDLLSSQQQLEQTNLQQQIINQKFEEQSNFITQQNQKLEELNQQHQQQMLQNQQLQQEIEYLRQKNEMEIEYQRKIHEAQQNSQIIQSITGTIGQVFTAMIQSKTTKK